MTSSSNLNPYASVAAEWSDQPASDQWTVRRLVRQPDEVPMYFERPPKEWPSKIEILGLEEYLAVAIARGRALLTLPHPVLPGQATLTSIDPDFSLAEVSGDQLEDPTAYYDAISDILQAAVFAGWDPEDLCRVALAAQHHERNEAVRAARERAHGHRGDSLEE